MDNNEGSLTEIEVQMKRGTPEKCVLLSHSAPSVKMFYALRMRLETSSEAWLKEFLDLDGLSTLLESLCQMTGKGFTSFSDAILQLDCIACVRAILNTSVGLDFMVRNDHYTPKLALALNMNNTLPKKQVLEMMSAICAYNNLGYQTVLTALNVLKRDTDQTHRFSIVVNELKSAETVAHKTAVLTFINCVINCTPDVVERNRIRNEFIGLNLLDVLSFLRKEEVDDDLHLQLEIFHEKKHGDEEVLSQEHQVDFNSPEDLVDMIQSKIFGTSKMVSFVNILQDLLAIDTVYNKNSSTGHAKTRRAYAMAVVRHVNNSLVIATPPECVKLWKTLDNMIHQAIHVCECDKLAVSMETTQMNLDLLPEDCDHGLQYIKNYQMTLAQQNERQADKPKNAQESSEFGFSVLEAGHPDTGQVRVSPQYVKIDNDTGVELTHNMDRSKSDNEMIYSLSMSQYDNVFTSVSSMDTPTNKSALQRRYQIRKVPHPPPSRKLKHLPWVKIMDSAIDRYAASLWTVTNSNRKLLPDYGQLEKLFCHYDVDVEECSEVVLLSPHTRHKLNLFLNRMEISPEDLVQSLETGNSVVVNLPTLRYLLKVLPEPDEIAVLQCYGGRRLALDMPEYFVLLLADIPDYQTLIQGHLTRAEYTAGLSKLKSSLIVMNMMCRKIIEHNDLKDFLQLTLQVGNFLNHGFLQGDASGFRITCLERLLELKSTIPNQSLLHHIIKQVEEKDKAILQFVPDLLPLEKAVSSSLNDLKTEVTKFNKQLCHFIQLLASANHRLKDRFQPFIEEVKSELKSVQQSTNLLRDMTQKLANYFCEDLAQFDLETTLKSLYSFCKQIKKCQNDNETFMKQSQLARRKNDQFKSHRRNRLMSLDFGKDAVPACQKYIAVDTDTPPRYSTSTLGQPLPCPISLSSEFKAGIFTGQDISASSSMMEDRNQILEKILIDLHRGNFRPVIKSELHTPETDIEVLEFSNISFVGSPFTLRPKSCAALDEDFLSPPSTNVNLRTSSAADILSDELPEKQELETGGTTTSQLINTPKKPPRSQETLVDRRLDQIRKQVVIKQGTHNRSRSDLTDSILVTDKWMRYEEIRQQETLQEELAPLAEPESMCAITSLNLENNGRTVDREDVKYYEDQQKENKEENVCLLQEGPVLKIPDELQHPDMKNLESKGMKRPEKKSSVSNFFNKLSRAVLKPRNVQHNSDPAPGQAAKRFGMFGRRKASSNLSDKENIDLGDTAPLAGKYYRDNRKGKQERVKPHKGK